MSNMWMVRAGQGAFMFDKFKSDKAVAIGWDKVGDLSQVDNNEEIKQRVKQHWPEYKDGKKNIAAGQICRFRFDFKKGDYVVTYNSEDRTYLLGEIISDYEYNTNNGGYPHLRKVDWLGDIARDNLSTSTKNTLGAISTIFKIGEDAANEMLKVLKGEIVATKDVEDKDEELNEIKEDVVVKSQEFIKDKLIGLDWDEMQELVAGILRGMGYKTMVSPKGAARGRDIQASPDGLGLEDPRIVVEVKHRSGKIGSKDVRSFITGAGQGAKGLYVSTGGFSKEAKYEAERSHVPVTLIDIDKLVGLLIQYYDSLDTDTRTLVPLMKIYWPV